MKWPSQYQEQKLLKGQPFQIFRIPETYLSMLDSQVKSMATLQLPVLIKKVCVPTKISTSYLFTFLRLKIGRDILALDLSLACKFLPVYFTIKHFEHFLTYFSSLFD